MDYMRAGRPTVYSGIPMRSRLEARFAAYLDKNDIPWAYEPRAYASPDGQYLPDFELLWPTRIRPVFVEVKPKREMTRGVPERMGIIWASHPDALLLIVIDDDPELLRGDSGDWKPGPTLLGWVD